MNNLIMVDVKHEIDDLIMKDESVLGDVDFLGSQISAASLKSLKGQKPCYNEDPMERKAILSKGSIHLMMEVLCDKEDVAKVLKDVTRKYELLCQKLESLKEALLQEESDMNIPSIFGLHSNRDPNEGTFENNSTNQSAESSSSFPVASTPVNVVGVTAKVKSDAVHTMPLINDSPNYHLPTDEDPLCIWQPPNLPNDTAPMPFSRQSASTVPYNENLPSGANGNTPNGQCQKHTCVRRASFTKEPNLLPTHRRVDTEPIAVFAELGKTKRRRTCRFIANEDATSVTSKETWLDSNVSSQVNTITEDVGQVTSEESLNMEDDSVSDVGDLLPIHQQSDQDRLPHEETAPDANETSASNEDTVQSFRDTEAYPDDSQLRQPNGKPKRPCYFCSKYFSCLSSHMLRAHKNEPPIAEMKNVDCKTRSLKLAELKILALDRENRKRLEVGKVPLPLKKHDTSSENLIRCINCTGWYNRKYFFFHKRKCRNKPMVRS